MKTIDANKRNLLGLDTTSKYEPNKYEPIKSSYQHRLPKNLTYESYIQNLESNIDFNPYYRSTEHRARRALDFTDKIKDELWLKTRGPRRSVFSWNEYAAKENPEKYEAECAKWRDMKYTNDVVVIVDSPVTNDYSEFYRKFRDNEHAISTLIMQDNFKEQKRIGLDD